MAATDLIRLTGSGLYCEAGDFYIDPLKKVPRALITHGHADHVRPGSESYWTHTHGVPILRARIGARAVLNPVPYGEPLRFGQAVVSFHPAGHILGSAQIRVQVGDRVWVVTGDYKRDADPSCAPFEVVECDALITEATFALPIYQWQSPAEVAREIAQWWADNQAEGKASVMLCYSLGKTQRILAELARLPVPDSRPVLLHRSAMKITDAYRDAGIQMLPYEALPEDDGYDCGDWDGVSARYAGRFVITPPGTLDGEWTRALGPCSTAFASGWMQTSRGKRRGDHDRGFVLSDHADWHDLIRTVQESGAREVLVMHGSCETLARYLRETSSTRARVLEKGHA